MSTTLPTLSLKYETNQLAGSTARNNHNYNWSELESKYSALGSFLQGALDGYDLRFNNMIQNSESVNEVVDSRIDMLGNTYPTLKARLDTEQEATPLLIDTGIVSDATGVLKLKDLSGTVSTTGYYYTDIAQVSDISLPAMGYSETTVGKITDDTIATVTLS